MGGQAETVASYLREHHRPEASFEEAVAVAVHALEAGTVTPPTTGPGAQPAGTERRLSASMLEVAVLDRGKTRRCFRRIPVPILERLLAADAGASAKASEPTS